MPVIKGGLYGIGIFTNSRPVKGDGEYGHVTFTDVLNQFTHPNLYGSVLFVDLIAFPPYEDGLHVPPTYSLVEVPLFNNSEVSYGRHTEQYLEQDSNVRWAFKLSFETLSPYYKQQLLDFFIARKGNAYPFTLIHPLTEARIVVRFVQGVASYELFAHQLYDFGEVELIQVDEDIY